MKETRQYIYILKQIYKNCWYKISIIRNYFQYESNNIDYIQYNQNFIAHF
jgi:hypothetical protein